METSRLAWPVERRLFRRAPLVPRSLQVAVVLVGAMALMVVASTIGY